MLRTCGSNNTSNVIALLWWSSVKQIFILMCAVCGVACCGLVLRILYVESGVRCTAVAEAWFIDEAVAVAGAVRRRAGDVFVIAALHAVL